MIKGEIEIKNVSKKFRKELRSFRDIFEYIFGIKSPNDFLALEDVSFLLKQGEILGIIGDNGAGKSTLLKTIAGVVKPSSGKVWTSGKIAPLIELGAGFHQELTARENIFLFGAILGMSKKEIKENFNNIVEFSELSEWMDTPIKFFSSGMYLRLGFSIIAFSNPDILLVDEAFAVGDIAFQNKCFEKIDEFKKKNVTIFLVSHDHNLINIYAQKVIWLDKGKIMSFGDPEKVMTEYKNNFLNKIKSKTKTFFPILVKDKNISIEDISLKRDDMNIYKSTEPVEIHFIYSILEPMKSCVVGINIYNSAGLHIFSSHENSGKQGGQKGVGQHTTVCTIPANLLAIGKYHVDIAFLSQDPFMVFHEEKRVLWFEVRNTLENNPVLGDYKGDLPGIIRPLLDWQTFRI